MLSLKVGVVRCVVDTIRRWYDFDDISRQKDKRVVEWALATLSVLVDDAANLRRFCEAWKVNTDEGKALVAIRDFGYKGKMRANQLQSSKSQRGLQTPRACWDGWGWGTEGLGRGHTPGQPQYYQPTERKNKDINSKMSSRCANPESDRGEFLHLRIALLQ